MTPVIYTIGETVLDIIFRNGQPVSATPGGSMLNTAVSLARAGLNVEFISEFGNDQPGEIINIFLKKNNVGTRYIRRFNGGKTALALAFLDEKSNASYSFHTSYPKKRMKGPLPLTSKIDIVLFGSIYSITPGIHGKIKKWVRQARDRGSLIIYDPNFRESHSDILEQSKPRIIENMSLADIVRGSDEDFITVFALNKADDVREKLVSYGCKNLIITRNSKSLYAWFNDNKITIDIPAVTPLVSTVGAGDSFNAGIIYALVNSGITKRRLGRTGSGETEKIMKSGIAFAADVCKSFENYISPGFSKSLTS